ncbi:hypothetical protein NIES4071_101220 (plasmid) [Calothrix sp. NIES-4071]|nr:hypothetical protein NIES4071_101220 [Calothrix sp. NIES-4071]BAZ64503.1 hypothetical protein NIES4105_102360 [Calothrix sp. NIES-4105]
MNIQLFNYSISTLFVKNYTLVETELIRFIQRADFTNDLGLLYILLAK